MFLEFWFISSAHGLALGFPMRSHEEDGDAVSPQPTLSEVTQAWIAEATRLKLIDGPQDVAGLQELKKELGATYTNLTPGCSATELRVDGLNAIRTWMAGRMVAWLHPQFCGTRVCGWSRREKGVSDSRPN